MSKRSQPGNDSIRKEFPACLAVGRPRNIRGPSGENVATSEKRDNLRKIPPDPRDLVGASHSLKIFEGLATSTMHNCSLKVTAEGFCLTPYILARIKVISPLPFYPVFPPAEPQLSRVAAGWLRAFEIHIGIIIGTFFWHSLFILEPTFFRFRSRYGK